MTMIILIALFNQATPVFLNGKSFLTSSLLLLLLLSSSSLFHVLNVETITDILYFPPSLTLLPQASLCPWAIHICMYVLFG